jgi:hypothetical protein
MNLERLEAEISLVLNEEQFQKLLRDWINEAVLEIATEFELPTLKSPTAYKFQTDKNNWLLPFPKEANFHKKVFLAMDSYMNPILTKINGLEIDIQYLNELEQQHIAHGDHVEIVATTNFEGTDYLGYYPRATETIHIWFYVKPKPLMKPEDVPVCIPPAYREKVIVPLVIVKGLERLQDLIETPDPRQLEYWRALYKEGLYGSPGGSIGMVHYLAKTKGGPRRHGGRDPIGPGRYYRGYY